MPTIVNRKTGEAYDIDINKPPSREVLVSMVSKDNPTGESPLAPIPIDDPVVEPLIEEQPPF